MHDPRIGRFFAVDPLAPKYPFYSPYAFSGNRVVDAVELEGLEPDPVEKADATKTTPRIFVADTKFIYTKIHTAKSPSEFIQMLKSADRLFEGNGETYQYKGEGLTFSWTDIEKSGKGSTNKGYINLPTAKNGSKHIGDIGKLIGIIQFTAPSQKDKVFEINLTINNPESLLELGHKQLSVLAKVIDAIETESGTVTEFIPKNTNSAGKGTTSTYFRFYESKGYQADSMTIIMDGDTNTYIKDKPLDNDTIEMKPILKK